MELQNTRNHASHQPLVTLLVLESQASAGFEKHQVTPMTFNNLCLVFLSVWKRKLFFCLFCCVFVFTHFGECSMNKHSFPDHCV